MNVKFLAQGNNHLFLTGFEYMWPVILRLLVQQINHWTTPPNVVIMKVDMVDMSEI